MDPSCQIIIPTQPPGIQVAKLAFFRLSIFVRFVTAIGTHGHFQCTFLLVLEIVGSKERVHFLPWVTYQTLLGVMISTPLALGLIYFLITPILLFTIGSTLLTFVASFTNSWFTLQWTVSLATFLPLGLWFVLPESPRWLIATGRMKEAEQVIRIAAEKNGRRLTDKSLGSVNLEIKPKPVDIKDTVDQTLTFRDLFNPPLLKNTMIMFVVWPIVILGYYGITFGMARLSDDLFIDFALSSLIEIPSNVMVLLLMDILGRKPIFSSSLLFTGIACIVVGTLDKNGYYSVLRQFLAIVGKFFASGSIAIVYIYTAELYPSIIRSTAVGSCSFMARIGGISSPYIALYLPAVTNASAPYFLMGGAAVFGGILALLLPETLGSRLPETLEDLDQIKKNGKPFWKCIYPCSR